MTDQLTSKTTFRMALKLICKLGKFKFHILKGYVQLDSKFLIAHLKMIFFFWPTDENEILNFSLILCSNPNSN